MFRALTPVAFVVVCVRVSGNSKRNRLVLGLLRRIVSPTMPASSCDATVPATTVVTADVATGVTTQEPDEDSTAVVTGDVTTEVTEATPPVDPSRIISKWADPKPFPRWEQSPPGGNVSIWPVDKMPKRLPTAKELAEELYAAMQQQPGCAGRWVLAFSNECVIYPDVCKQLGWPPRPWMGKTGVAAYLAQLSPPKYRRVELNGEKRTLLHYFIPNPQATAVYRMGAQQRTA
jgi:hypothetical protein